MTEFALPGSSGAAEEITKLSKPLQFGLTQLVRWFFQIFSKKSLDSPVTGGSIRESVFKIGEFSVLTQVSIKTHRYDDAVGLLRVDVDSAIAITRPARFHGLHRILALKDLGFRCIGWPR